MKTNSKKDKKNNKIKTFTKCNKFTLFAKETDSNNNKVQYITSFNADMCQYDHMVCTMDGVLHGNQEPITGNHITSQQLSMKTYAELMKAEYTAYNGSAYSMSEAAITRALQLLFQNKKKINVSYNVCLGSRPGCTKPMYGDIIISSPKHKMLVEVHGGFNTNTNKSIWHGKHRPTDKYKETNYKKLGFDEYKVLKIYDCGPENDLKYTLLFMQPNGKKVGSHLIRASVLRKHVIDVVTSIELENNIKIKNSAITNAVNTTMQEIFEYAFSKKQSKYNIINAQ